LEVDEELGTFEVSRGHTDVVFRALVVEFGETPVDETELVCKLGEGPQRMS